jgi:hypothetical protein
VKPNVPVKGLGRHLELKELQKKKVQEQELREAQVFGLGHKFAVNADELDLGANRGAPPRFDHLVQKKEMSKDRFTIPEPFNLT